MLTTQVVITGVLSAEIVVVTRNEFLSTTDNIVATISVTLAALVTARRVVGVDASG